MCDSDQEHRTPPDQHRATVSFGQADCRSRIRLRSFTMQFGVTVALIPHSFESGYHLAARHSAAVEAQPVEHILQIGVANRPSSKKPAMPARPRPSYSACFLRPWRTLWASAISFNLSAVPGSLLRSERDFRASLRWARLMAFLPTLSETPSVLYQSCCLPNAFAVRSSRRVLAFLVFGVDDAPTRTGAGRTGLAARRADVGRRLRAALRCLGIEGLAGLLQNHF